MELKSLGCISVLLCIDCCRFLLVIVEPLSVPRAQVKIREGGEAFLRGSIPQAGTGNPTIWEEFSEAERQR